jgi:hypothetical protein
MTYFDVFKNFPYSYLYQIKPGDSLSKIIYSLYGEYSSPQLPHIDQSNLGQMIRTIMHNNPHINDPNLIIPGDLIDVSPYKKPDFERLTMSNMTSVKEIISPVSQGDIDIIMSSPDFFSNILDKVNTSRAISYGGYSALAGIDGAFAAAENGLRLVANNLETIDLNRGGSLSDQISKWKKSNQTRMNFNNMARSIKNSVLKDVHGPSAQVSRSTKVITLPSNIRPHHITKYIENSCKVAKYAKWGKLGFQWGVPIVIGAIEVYQDGGNKYRATTKAASSVLGGVLSSHAASILVCGVILGLTTGGTGMLACSFIAGGIGGAGGSILSGKIGEELYDAL